MTGFGHISAFARWAGLVALTACTATLDPVTGSPLPESGPLLANPVEPDVVTADVLLTVRTDRELVAVSPWIYGVNGRPSSTAVTPRLFRQAGNRFTAYNWENNASNAGEYFDFQNDAFLSTSDEPGAAVRSVLDNARSTAGAAVVTLPILDHVAADKLGGGDVRNSGADWLTTRFLANLPANPGGATPVPSSSDRAVYQDDFVTWLKSEYEGTAIFLGLDAEPDLWHRTHPTLEPEPVGYGELVERTLRFATGAKAAWPAAKVIGLGATGWSAWESLKGPDGADPPDAEGKGSFLEYWLTALAAAERTSGRRLVDYVDLHWRSEARGGGVRVVADDDSAEVVAARVQAPRSLWDPSFVEDSWIAGDPTGGAAIRLIPRTLERIARTYPGTGLAICDWEFGGGDHISGALAAAEALGAFGRYGVGIAAHKLDPGPWVIAALTAFLDYDGRGSKFGDTALLAVSSDVARASVYASFDWANQSRVVVLVINKDTAPLVTGLRLAHPERFTRASRWVLDASSPHLRPGEPLEAVGTNVFRFTAPASSLSVLVPAAVDSEPTE